MARHLDPEEIALYADRGVSAPGAAGIVAHLRSCEACLHEVVEARNLSDLTAEAKGSTLPPRTLSPRLARYLRSKPDEAKPVKAALGIAGLFGTAVAALSSSRASEAVAFGDVRNEGHGASSGVEGHDMAGTHGFSRPDPIIGTPVDDGGHFPGQQSYTDTCAIRCQEYIIRQYLGSDAPEKFFVDEARAHGWYHDGEGTRPADVGNLLELHGIPVHRYIHANPWLLAAELGQGHKVIIGVDSDELWRQSPVLTEIRHLFGLGTADHAVVVSGIDTSNPVDVQVIISDPATGEATARYPMEQFLHAWKDSEFFMVATQQPPPAELHLPEMNHFDYGVGHIDHVGQLSWDDFQHASTPLDLHGWLQPTDPLHGHGDPLAPEHDFPAGHGHDAGHGEVEHGAFDLHHHDDPDPGHWILADDGEDAPNTHHEGDPGDFHHHWPGDDGGHHD